MLGQAYSDHALSLGRISYEVIKDGSNASKMEIKSQIIKIAGMPSKRFRDSNLQALLMH